MSLAAEPEPFVLVPVATETKDDVDILDVCILLSERRRVIFCAMLAAALVSAVVALFLPNFYEARTSLLPPQPTQSTNNLMAGQISAMTGISARELGLKNPADLYVALLASESVANSLIDRYRLRELYGESNVADARRRLAKRTSIVGGKDGLITLVVQDRDPHRAADIANGYVEELQKLNARLAITEAAQRRLFFEQQLEKVKSSLLNAEMQMSDTERRTGVVELEAHAKALVEQIAVLRGRLAAKEVEAHAMESFATDQNPDYRRALRELDALRAELANLERGPGEGATGSMKKLSGGAVEYAGHLREVKYQETLFEMISRQYEAARIDEAREGTVIQIVDRASSPEEHSWPRRGFIVIAATLLAAFCSTVYVLTEKSIHRAISDPARSSKLSNLKHSWKRLI